MGVLRIREEVEPDIGQAPIEPSRVAKAEIGRTLAIALRLGGRLAARFRPVLIGHLVRSEGHGEVQIIARLHQALREAGGERLAVDRLGLNAFVQLGRYGGDTVRKGVILLQRHLQVRNDFPLRLAVEGLRDDRCWGQCRDSQKRKNKPRKHI